MQHFSNALIRVPVMFHLPRQRHHFAQAIAILNTVGCNIFEKFSRKVRGNLTFTRCNCLSLCLGPFPFAMRCHVCMRKLNVFVILYFRTISGCWIWFETSFWLLTWLTTFASSKTCRKLPTVCPSRSSLLLVYSHPKQQMPVQIGVVKLNHNLCFSL